MQLFKNIITGDDYKIIGAAAAAILERVNDLNLMTTAWSLVELQLDEEDFIWLRTWARQLKSGVAYRCLHDGRWHKFQIEQERYSYSECIGLLLLMLACETARRETDERGLWGAIHSCFSSTTQAVLFVQGSPTRLHKDVLELAARRFQLRHVFGQEGLQNWYDSVALQFGFSKQSFLRRLPEWLVGQAQPFAVQRLLEGPMQSKSFLSLWETLRDFRQKNITENTFQRRLRSNPWILPDWLEELERQASARLNLEGRTGSAVATSLSNDEQFVEPFLTPPTLHWSPFSEVRFTTQVTNLASLDLTEASYNIIIAGKSQVRLFRQADDTYYAEPSESISLPTTRSDLVANLTTPDGQIVQSLTLQLWDVNEEVIVYKTKSGQRINSWHDIMRPTEGYIIQLSSELTITPKPPYWHHLGRTILYWLEADWSPHLQVVMEKDVLWYPRLTHSSSSLEEQATAKIEEDIIVTLSNTKTVVRFGESIGIFIVHPAQATITFVRLGGQPLDIERASSRHVIASFVLHPSLFTTLTEAKIALHIGVKTPASLLRLVKEVSVPCVDIIVLTDEGWFPLDKGMPLTVEQAQRQLTRIFTPGEEVWSLFEGNVGVKQAWKHPSLIGSLSGFGAPLMLKEGVYNVLRDPCIFSQAVTHPGCIAQITIGDTAPDRTLYVRLNGHIEPDKHHTLLWWDSNGTAHVLASISTDLHDGKMWWKSPLSSDLTQPLAVAVSYNGIRLGTWWDLNWSSILRKNSIPPLLTAALLRWLQIPLLSFRYIDDIKHFVAHHPEEVCSTWIADIVPDHALPMPLQWTEIGDGWLSTVRTLIQDWQPQEEVIQAIFHALVDDDAAQASSQEQLLQVFWLLLRVSPLFMGKVLLTWFRGERHQTLDRQKIQKQIDYLLQSLMETTPTTSSIVRQKEDSLKQSVADEMGVDANFLERSLIPKALDLFRGQPLPSLHNNNINVACNNEQFRRFLGMQALKQMSQMLGGRR